METSLDRIERALLARAPDKGRAPQQHSWLAEPRPHIQRGPLANVRRKALIFEARHLASRYRLNDEMWAWTQAAGCAALGGLHTEQLEQLVAKLALAGERMDTVCDAPDWPPAR